MKRESKLLLTAFGLVSVYLLGYVYARGAVFHAVETYAGGDKAGARQDYIAKRDRPAGEGWEYWLFLPAIRAEEGIRNYFHNS